MHKISLLLAVLCLSLVYSEVRAADCRLASGNERLGTFCTLNSIIGVEFSSEQELINTLGAVSYRLHRIGQPLLIPAKFQHSWFDLYANPILDYNSNINGGNRNREFGIFTGAREDLAKSGFTLGGRIGFGGRYIFQKPEQRNYINYGMSYSAEYSLVHSLGIYRQNSYFCSANPFSNWWYLDLCANISKFEREKSDNRTYYASATLLKYFESFAKNYHEFQFGWNHIINDDLRDVANQTDYSQNRFSIGIENTHNTNLTSSLNLLWGLNTPVCPDEDNKSMFCIENTFSFRPDTLPLTKLHVSGSLGTIVGGKLLSLSGSFSNSYTVQLIGDKRTDQTWSISATYPIWRNFTATIGYSKTESTNDFYDVAEPFYRLRISPLVFLITSNPYVYSTTNFSV